MDKPQETGGARRAWLGRGIALAVLLAACAVAYWFGVAHKGTGADNTGLRVAPEHLNLGEVWEEEQFRWVVPVTNSSGEDVEVVKFATSCNCLSVEPRAVVIPAGQTVGLNLVLNLTGKSSQQANRRGRDFQVHLFPQLRAGLPYQPGWTLRGRVLRPIDFAPPFVDFGESLVRGRSFPSRKVQVKAFTPLGQPEATCDAALASTWLVPREGTDDYDLEIKPKETLPTGPFEFKVSFRGRILSDNQALVEKALLVRGVVVGEARATPSSVVFGAARVGEQLQATVVLDSASGSPLAVDKIDISSPDVKVEAVDAVTPLRRQYRILQEVSRTGFQSASITFRLREQDHGGIITITVPVSCHGLTPD
jgi:hypothetical protein